MKEKQKTKKSDFPKVSALGRELKISPKSLVTFNSTRKTEFLSPTVSVIVGIGKDEYAELIMSVDAWKALKNGASVDIETVQSFKKKHIIE
jgi:hypothetical protein